MTFVYVARGRRRRVPGTVCSDGSSCTDVDCSGGPVVSAALGYRVCNGPPVVDSQMTGVLSELRRVPTTRFGVPGPDGSSDSGSRTDRDVTPVPTCSAHTSDRRVEALDLPGHRARTPEGPVEWTCERATTIATSRVEALGVAGEIRGASRRDVLLVLGPRYSPYRHLKLWPF